jgi:hypothetical protein
MMQRRIVAFFHAQRGHGRRKGEGKIHLERRADHPLTLPAHAILAGALSSGEASRKEG